MNRLVCSLLNRIWGSALSSSGILIVLALIFAYIFLIVVLKGTSVNLVFINRFASLEISLLLQLNFIDEEREFSFLSSLIFFLCLSKRVSSSGFVNMSAICSPVATWYMLTVPFLTSSLEWWYLILRCLVYLWRLWLDWICPRTSQWCCWVQEPELCWRQWSSSPRGSHLTSDSSSSSCVAWISSSATSGKYHSIIIGYSCATISQRSIKKFTYLLHLTMACVVALSSKVLSFLFITFLAAFSDNCKIFNTSNKDQKATKKLFVTVCCDCR